MAYQILIVDDDPEFREELRYLLQDDYKITEASNGAQALGLIRKPNAFDLVILDVIMPGMHGTEVLKEVKELKPNLPIIILTGRSSKDVAIEALKAHADDFLEKPFHVDQFLETIRKILTDKVKASVPQAQDSGIEGKIAQAKYFITRNYDKKISLNDMADQLALSPKYFSRVFKQIVGKGFNEFRLKIKMEEAAHILKSSTCTINELADRLGYQNTESFIRGFKDIMGQTPQDFRINGPVKKGRRRVAK